MSDVDLRKLSAGDRVEVNGKLLLVFKVVCHKKDNIFEQDLYQVFIDGDPDENRFSSWNYRIDGSYFIGFHPITKVVKQWTDEDMKSAFEKGNEYARFSVDEDGADKWLEQYKSS